jgi:hypothetical protein
MPAISGLIFRVAALQKQTRLLVTFFVQIMQQRRVRLTGELAGQFIQTRKNRQQARLGIRRRHGLDGFCQLREGNQQFGFDRSVHALKIYCGRIRDNSRVSQEC